MIRRKSGKSLLEQRIRQLKSGELSEEGFLNFLENYPYMNMGNIKLGHCTAGKNY